MFALDLSPTGSLSDDSPDAFTPPGSITLTQERFDSLRSAETPLERFAPAWSELLQRAVEEPGLICEAYSRFHGYSLGNRFAALLQCQMRGLEPGPLNSFNGWRKLGYGVQEGQKALVLCMPLKGTLHREKKGGEISEVAANSSHANGKASSGAPDVEAVEYIRAFVWKPNWFVLSQTVPLSEHTEALPAPAPTSWDQALALTALDITPVPFDIMDGNALGFASARTVAVSPLSPYPFKTLFHELAHVVLGHTTANFRGEGNAALQLSDGHELSHALIEVEAESVALLCLATLDLPDQEFCRGYIQHWLSGPDGLAQDIPEKSAQRIFGAADRILCAGVGETRVRAPTAEEIGLNGAPSVMAAGAPSALPAPDEVVPQTIASIALPSALKVEATDEAGLPPPTPQLVSRGSDNLSLERDNVQEQTTTAKAVSAPKPTENSEGDAWTLHGHLQNLHHELHPQESATSARFASALRVLKERDPAIAREVQQLVKNASRDIKKAFSQIEAALEEDQLTAHNTPLEGEEFDLFADMGAGEVLRTDFEVPADFLRSHPTIERAPKSPQNGDNSHSTHGHSANDHSTNDHSTVGYPTNGDSTNGHGVSEGAVSNGTGAAEQATVTTLSPTRQAAARRAVGRTLKAELQFEKERFTQTAKTHELPMGRTHQKAMLAALSAYLEVPLSAQRDVSSHQWARGASAIETEDLRW